MKRFKTPAIIVISLVFIVLILTNVSMSDVTGSLYSIGIGTFLLCLLIHFCVYFLRSVTMAVFLRKEVPLLYLLNAHLIHNFYLNIIPASMGELSLPIILEKFVSKTRSFSVLVITRIFSILVIFVLFLISISYLFNRFDLIEIKSSYIYLGLVILAVALILFLLLRKKKVFKHALVTKITDKFMAVINGMLYSLRKELNFSTISILTLSTLAYTLFLALFYKVILMKLNIPLNLMELFFIMSIQVAILILPIKSFGGFGTTEGAWMLGMMALGIDKKIALESGFVIHIIALLSAAFFFVIGLVTRFLMDRHLNIETKPRHAT